MTTRHTVRALLTLTTAAVLTSTPAAAQAPAQPAAKPAPKPAQGKGTAPVKRKWEVDVFAGGSIGSTASTGTGAIPPANANFIAASGFATRNTASWFFGDGALLLNQIGATFKQFGLTAPPLVPLDPVLTKSSTHLGGGGTFGARINRSLTKRVGVEIAVGFGTNGPRLLSSVAPAVEATRASFPGVFTAIFASPLLANPVITADKTVTDGGHQVQATGALTWSFSPAGKLTPYLVVGGGVVANSSAQVTLKGRYTLTIGGSSVPGFEAPGPIDDTDALTVHYHGGSAFVAVFGGGFKYPLSPKMGICVDVRDAIGGNPASISVDAKPVVVAGSPKGFIASNAQPAIQVSGDPTVKDSLSGAPLTGFKTFMGSGHLNVLTFTGGVYFKF